MGRIFRWAWLSVLLLAAPVVLQPSAVKAQVTTYGATNRSTVTVVPTRDYAIPIPNLTILLAYDFEHRTRQDFIPFAQNLGFNVQTGGDLTTGTWSISVYVPGNAKPVMEIAANEHVSTGQPSGLENLACAWGAHRTASINFDEDQNANALFPGSDSDCGNKILYKCRPKRA